MPPVNAAMRCANFEERRDRAMALFAEKGLARSACANWRRMSA